MIIYYIMTIYVKSKVKQAQGGLEEMKFGGTLRMNSEFPGSNGVEGCSRQRKWLRNGIETLKPIGERRGSFEVGHR